MRKDIRATISALGGYVPSNILTNEFLSTIVDTSDEWIKQRTGIKERRIATAEDEATSDLAASAIRNLLDTYQVKPEEIEAVILATATPDHLLSPASSLVCKKSGLSNAFGFDLNGACSGFLFGLTMGASLIESGRYRKVIVVGADKMSSIVDYNDRNSCILFGDGAGAVLLEPTTENYGVMDSVLRTDGAGNDALLVPAGGSRLPATNETLQNRAHYIKQHGALVFKNAVESMATASGEALDLNDLDANEIDWVIPHQANMRIIQAVSDRLNIPFEKVKINIERYGNTTSATVPLVLWDFAEDFEPGQNLLITTFGAGFSWGATCLRWGQLIAKKEQFEYALPESVTI
ncbi:MULTISPECIES: beta-ketoacyl-ACP synthase III [unclassified Chitinophaga]|uniref:beta-ketoacyl-ACP synthase III n=1 Tax=unclassified Chitinophaga TaxID=2619133 RepID=UPI0009C5560E|nr:MULTISPECIES: beta-ketoacyl-ACP synthase III [unclassified Chitinophaga]OMP75759.1 3-oxoacyl-ACP synthase [[Flexibacter] sp. ATCC 35208]WPV66263.1 beta-ketoacyl-ACP synthase III [Chitinophaga sp. LS1]